LEVLLLLLSRQS